MSCGAQERETQRIETKKYHLVSCSRYLVHVAVGWTYQIALFPLCVREDDSRSAIIRVETIIVTFGLMNV